MFAQSWGTDDASTIRMLTLQAARQVTYSGFARSNADAGRLRGDVIWRFIIT
jgi:hypothetical protein